MTPQAFIAKWRGNLLTERAGAQAHFEDLCTLLKAPGQDLGSGFACVRSRKLFVWTERAISLFFS
jgi:hypothetical protein